jgi:hypothetical protein
MVLACVPCNNRKGHWLLRELPPGWQTMDKDEIRSYVMGFRRKERKGNRKQRRRNLEGLKQEVRELQADGEDTGPTI